MAGNARQEVVLEFLFLQAGVQPRPGLLQPFGEGLLRAARHLVAHEDADGIDLLPLVLQAQQAADLEVAGGHVDGLGELAPVVQVALDLPVVVAVIDDEQFAAGLARAFGHDIPAMYVSKNKLWCGRPACPYAAETATPQTAELFLNMYYDLGRCNLACQEHRCAAGFSGKSVARRRFQAVDKV